LYCKYLLFISIKDRQMKTKKFEQNHTKKNYYFKFSFMDHDPDNWKIWIRILPKYAKCYSNIRARYTLTLLKGKRSENVQFASKKCLRSAMGSNFYLKLFIIKFSETFCNIKFKCKKNCVKKGGERG